MSGFESLSSLKNVIPIVLILFLIVVAIVIISKVLKTVQRTARSIKSTITDVTTVVNAVKEIADAADDIPDIKTVGGATDMYLKSIVRDFPDYHNSAAESDIRTFIHEYVNITYGTMEKFEKSQISSKILIGVNKISSGVITNLLINKIAIYGYKKTKEYATIEYRVSVGFDVDGKRIETRYKVGYTYQMYDDNIATNAMKCPNCGAPLAELKNGACPYCGAAITKDTIMSWDITSIDNF